MLVKKDQGLGKIFVENCIISWIKSNRERERKKKDDSKENNGAILEVQW